MSNETEWYDDLADALASRRLEQARVEEIVAEAKAHCDATGERPDDAFGDADTYAAHLTSDEDPDETRFQHMAERYSWSTQPARYQALSTFGASLAFAGAAGWLIVGAWHTLTAIEAFTLATTFGAVIIMQLRDDARAAGHPMTARRILVGWAALIIAGVVASPYLPQSWAIRLPLPHLTIAGIVLLGAGWWLGGRWLKAHPPQERLPRDSWLDRLAGLLEGRHRLSAARAREFRAEAASHLDESGGDP